jgi:hypothetical protein
MKWLFEYVQWAENQFKNDVIIVAGGKKIK